MIRSVCLVLSAGLMPAMTVAQTAPDMEITWQAANNQLGILQYCEQEGFTGPEAIEAQAQLISMLPSGNEAAGTGAADLGSQGIIAFDGQQMDLSDAVQSQGSTVEATCQQIEAAVKDMASSLSAG